MMWARWDSSPEENANEPRGRAESERRRMVWWFGGDCRVETLVPAEQEDRFGAGAFRAEIGGVSSVEVICCLSEFEAMYVGKYAANEQSLQDRYYLRQSLQNLCIHNVQIRMTTSYLYIEPFREADSRIQ